MGLGASPTRKSFKKRLFTLAINVTDTLFGTTVVLERDENSANFMSYERKSFCYFAIDEIYQQEEGKVF